MCITDIYVQKLTFSSFSVKFNMFVLKISHCVRPSSKYVLVMKRHKTLTHYYIIRDVICIDIILNSPFHSLLNNNVMSHTLVSSIFRSFHG